MGVADNDSTRADFPLAKTRDEVETTMVTFDKHKDPSRCTGSGDRYSIDGCQVVEHRGKHYIASTDGRMLCMVACEVEAYDHPGGVYPSQAFATARKQSVGKLAKIALNGKATVQAGGAMQEWSPMDDRFPDVCAVVNGAQKEAGKVVTVSLNAELLADLQKAIGAGAVTLRINVDDVSVPIMVDHCATKKDKADRDGSFGLIMQIGKV